MKKIYLSAFALALVSGLNAQVKQNGAPVMRSNDRSEKNTDYTPAVVEKSVPIWQSTFDNANDWDIDHDANDCSLDWQIGTISCAGAYAIADIGTQGPWAILDSDYYGGTGGGSEVEDSWLTMANPVDLTLYPNVVVEFETNYRRYNYERPFLVVGFGDGTGAGSVVWPTNLDPSTDPSTLSNVFDVFPNFANSAATSNPETVQINISSALVGATPLQLQNVYIRLNWTGTWGYAWFVDNFRVIEQPLDDVQTTNAWISGENNTGVEYGRNPLGHLDDNWYIGGQVFNFGVNDQLNIVLDMDFTAFSSQGNDALLEADSTVTFESLLSGLGSGALNVGTTTTFTGTYTSTSTAETGGADFGNNVRQRVFEVTTAPQQLYSTDGIDIYPPADVNLASIGTNSFSVSAPGSEDGLVLASMYHIKQTAQVSGMQIMLASGTVAGGEIYISIKDTTTFWQDDMASLFAASQPVIVSQNDINNGYVDAYFDAPVTLTPGEYYAAIELYSNGNANDIRVLDDRTVAQPYYTASIYIPGDATYSNGTALGIRLMMGTDWGAGIEENILAGVSVYPNPSEGLVNVSNENSTENTIVVTDLAGRQVLSMTTSSAATLDLTKAGTGVYVVTVSNANGSMAERVVIK